MTKTGVFIVALLALAAPAGAVEQLVCPPGLTYCYPIDKPIRSGPTPEDEHAMFRQRQECIQRVIDTGIGDANWCYNHYRLPGDNQRSYR